MKLFRFGLVLSFVLLSSAFAPSVFSQCYIWNGNQWTGNSVTYSINSGLATNDASEQDWKNAINSAVAQWNGAGANFEFNQGSDVSYDPNTEPAGVYQLGWYAQSGDPTTAYTNVTDDPNNSAVITKVETYFNEAYDYSANPSSTQLDIWTIAVHELGHWLDLQSETDPGCSSNVMYEYKSEGDISHRYLTDDDKAGIVSIYGSVVGVEDYINIYDGPTSITQNSQEVYDWDFIDNYPYGDYLVSASADLLIEHGEGEYDPSCYDKSCNISTWHIALWVLLA